MVFTFGNLLVVTTTEQSKRKKRGFLTTRNIQKFVTFAIPVICNTLSSEMLSLDIVAVFGRQTNKHSAFTLLAILDWSLLKTTDLSKLQV